MAAEKLDLVGPDVDQQEKTLPPSEEEDTPLVSDEPSAPLDFSELTPLQFGISVQSFSPKLSSNCKDKSLLAQIKARRRSNIGARGSPETNSLIRFMAQQRMKTPPASRTPELVRSSPFLPRVASTLRQKMASFQMLMDVAESDACDLAAAAAQDGDTGGCIRTRDYLSDGSSHDAGKENNPPATPTPSKRRRLGPLEGCGEEIREAGAPILHSSLKEQEVTEARATQDVTEGPLPSSGAVEETPAALIPQTLDANFDFTPYSPSRKHQDGVFEVQSPSRPPPVAPAAATPPQPSSPFHIPPFPSLLEMKPTDEDGTMEARRKKVRFGAPLSPEVFDKNLPPDTPLRKGSTPARPATPGGSLQLRSALKTPQRSASRTPQSQPSLGSPDFGASPTFSIPCSHRQGSEIVFPSAEESSSPSTSDPECVWDALPVNLNSAFQEESLSQTETETSEKPEAAVEDSPSAKSNKRTKDSLTCRVSVQTGPDQEPAAAASSRPGGRKRKQPEEESQPVKRSTRSAAKSASTKMKTTSGRARQWSKDVDRSLYGSRAYASKNPDLSPIKELARRSQSQAAAQTATNHDALQNPEADPSSAAGKSRTPLGLKARGRAQRKRKVTIPEESPLSEEKENCEDQTAADVDAAPGTQPEPDAPRRGDAEEPSAVTSEPTPCSSWEGDPDSALAADSEPVLRKRGRRSSRIVPVLQEQQNLTGEAAERQQGSLQSSQEEQSPSSKALAPWQDDFNFEDVFKPVATRGQRSVRRSLRLSSADPEHGAGLAWIPRNSPDERRKTRGRRLSAALPEETQDAP
ncbi:cell division cycle-associated protein 2 isoform X1 [Salarias fasciatus]|nr:cell division cycle-associated protein 2 isoform X1 [Salarias fasciatus]XP_029959823.1 cell division cycle-associated protein 2 isoform X1 [Salarias fasciatus]